MDLNSLRIPRAGDDNGAKLALHNATSKDGSTTVYFRDLQARVIEHIHTADVVLGCVAWLTSFEVLKALAQKKGVSIIVQKEDFLRPDSNAVNDTWHIQLKQLYLQLYPCLTRRNIGGQLADMRDRGFQSVAEELAKEWFIEDPMDAIRCVGISAETTKKRSQPRMHNKFLVFGHWDGEGDVNPYAVWTGSYNLSATAEKSFENALLIRDPEIVAAFYSEYTQIACLSEPLNWKSATANPEWWRGTDSNWDRFDPLAGKY